MNKILITLIFINIILAVVLAILIAINSQTLITLQNISAQSQVQDSPDFIICHIETEGGSVPWCTKRVEPGAQSEVRVIGNAEYIYMAPYEVGLWMKLREN